MTTARQVIRLAFKQLLVTGIGEEPIAEDMGDSLDLLNQMVHGWRSDGVDLLWSDITLNDAVSFWVPPKAADGNTVNDAVYAGAWDASTNTPTLATGSGTSGTVYKVSVAGTTTLDEVTSWSVGDYLVFDGFEQKWMKCRTSQQFITDITAMLAVQMSTLFSVQPSPDLAMRADAGWRRLQANFVVAPLVAVDDALRRMNSNRYINGNLL